MRLELTPMQMDALQEIGNVSAGNAATTLSELLGRRLGISIPHVRRVDLVQAAEVLGGSEKIVIAFNALVSNGLPASILLIFPEDEGHRLFEALLGPALDLPNKAIPWDSDALTRFAEITLQSYINAFAGFVNLPLAISPPQTALDMLQAVLDETLIKLSAEVNDLIILETEFTVNDIQAQGLFLLVPEPGALLQTFKNLGL